MINIIATEIDLTTKNCDHIKYMQFDLDDSKEFCYRSRMSYNAFVYGGINHNKKSPCWKKIGKNYVRLYHCQHEDTCYIDNISLPIIKLKSIWEFYSYIGYNYKNKKWIDI